MYNLVVWLHEMKLDSIVSCHSEMGGIFTVITTGFSDSLFQVRFNRWNESNGIEYSAVKLHDSVWILYPKNNNGVQITDLTE